MTTAAVFLAVSLIAATVVTVTASFAAIDRPRCNATQPTGDPTGRAHRCSLGAGHRGQHLSHGVYADVRWVA